jgi:hypothetical protein
MGRLFFPYLEIHFGISFNELSIMEKKVLFFLLAFGGLFSTISCDALRTAAFDQYSYQQAIEIKVESARLMDKAITSYSENREAVEDLWLELDKIIAYEENKPYNDITLEMWKILSDEERNLLGGFLKRWQEEGTLSAGFVQEAKGQVMEAIDLIIQYEAKKEKETKDKLVSLISQY